MEVVRGEDTEERIRLIIGKINTCIVIKGLYEKWAYWDYTPLHVEVMLGTISNYNYGTTGEARLNSATSCIVSTGQVTDMRSDRVQKSDLH